MRMLFKDYVELLYRAYLENEKVLRRLREKLEDIDYLKRLDGDPDFQDWNQINPRDLDPRKRSKSKYHSHPLDPQQGVRVFEGNNKAVNKVREIIKRRRKNGFKNHQQNSRKQSEADSL